MPTETGFCDYEQTTDSVFGDYTWLESLGGQSVAQLCVRSDAMAVRTCIGMEQGWSNLIDFSNCRDSKYNLPQLSE